MRQNVEALTIPMGDGGQVIVPIRSVAAALLSQHPIAPQRWKSRAGVAGPVD